MAFVAFGQPVTFSDLIQAVESGVAADTAMPRDAVFTSLADDVDLLKAPPRDQFIAIRPWDFPVDLPTTASGGRTLCGFNARWDFTCFARLKTDQETRSGKLLKDNLGVLTLVLRLVKAAEMFTPLDESGKCVLREPARMTGFEVRPKTIVGGKENSPWQVVATHWELKFTLDLS